MQNRVILKHTQEDTRERSHSRVLGRNAVGAFRDRTNLPVTGDHTTV